MKKYKLLKQFFLNFFISLMAVTTAVICFFYLEKDVVKEYTSNIYINSDSISLHSAEAKVLSDVPIPDSFSFSLPVLMYHVAPDNYSDGNNNNNYITASKLREQLKYIKTNNYDTVYITELDKLYKYTKPVSLTFDNVDLYFYTIAFPLFMEYNLRASIYINTNNINKQNYLTTAQINEMKETGLIDIESNALNYTNLTNLTIEEAKNEIINSKVMLRLLLDVDSKVFCYPYGTYNDSVVDIVKDNYSAALTVENEVYISDKRDVYRIPRINVTNNMSLNTFVNYLNKSKVNIVDK